MRVLSLLLQQLLICLTQLRLVHQRTGNQVGVAAVVDADLAHHLADNDLDVLVVDVNAWGTVYALYLFDQVVLNCQLAADCQNLALAPQRPR